MATIRRERDGVEALLSTEHVIGRMRSCGTCLGASYVSLAHALVRWGGSSWEIRDLGSTNGTYLDGVRLLPGESSRLRSGCVLTFGGDGEKWRLVTDGAPLPCAIPLDGGEAAHLLSGVLPIYENEALAATIYPDAEQWYLEVDDSRVPLAHGQHFSVLGREWRFECPGAVSSTLLGETPLLGLDEVVLEFAYSADEEHVSVSFGTGPGRRTLRERSCLYLALVLARCRNDDQRQGSAEHGWVSVNRLLDMIPDYGSYSALNVEIFRLRRMFSEAGVTDFSRIIERRRGELRLGASRLFFRREADPVAPRLSEERA